jgi:hypothetical protein
MAPATDSAPVRGPVLALALEQARVRALGQAPATEPASLREQSERVRRFHMLTLQWPQSPEIPLLAKSVERWTKSSP